MGEGKEVQNLQDNMDKRKQVYELQVGMEEGNGSAGAEREHEEGE